MIPARQAINLLDMHPTWTYLELIDACRREGIRIEVEQAAYLTGAAGVSGVFPNEVQATRLPKTTVRDEVWKRIAKNNRRRFGPCTENRG